RPHRRRLQRRRRDGRRPDAPHRRRAGRALRGPARRRRRAAGRRARAHAVQYELACRVPRHQPATGRRRAAHRRPPPRPRLSAGARFVAHRLAADWQSVRVVHPWGRGNPHPPLPAEARPNDTFRDLDGAVPEGEYGGVRVSYALLPFAHTDSSLYVYLPDANVIAIGGVTNGPRSAWTEIEHRGNWPEIDWWTGGRGNRIAPALETIIERTNADTIVVPAQGGLLTIEDLD